MITYYISFVTLPYIMLKQYSSCLFIILITFLILSESYSRMWIYTELYSNSVCSYSSAEYAFGVSTDSCVTQSPFFESFFDLPLVKSFKVEGTDCSSTRLRLYEDSTCDEKDAVLKSIEDEKWGALVDTIGQCNPDIRYTEPQYHSQLLCVPIIDDKIPTLNFNSFISSGYPEHYGLNTQQKEESCLTDLLPSTFAAIPSDRCDSSIPPYLIPMFPTVLTMQKSAYKFDCTNAEAVGYATEYKYLNEVICTGAGASKKISLNVCNNVEQLLNPADSELSESSKPQQLLQGRHLQEDPKVESSPFHHLSEYENVTMRYLSMLEELDNNGTQPIIHHVKYNCVKGNQTKTASPAASPTLLATLTPTVITSITPSLVPTNQPTDYPSEGSTTQEPSVSPTIEPTSSPISKPSIGPTTTTAPSAYPSSLPPLTVVPNSDPSNFPTTEFPSADPTCLPSTGVPTVSPSSFPTTAAPSWTSSSHLPTTDVPNSDPSNPPTTEVPSVCPSCLPSTGIPSFKPYFQPTTTAPSWTPSSRLPFTVVPNSEPSNLPTTAAPSSSYPTTGTPSTSYPTTGIPSFSPSSQPTTAAPSSAPSYCPSSTVPTSAPSYYPTTSSSTLPSFRPSYGPSSGSPSHNPSSGPTSSSPSRPPSRSPTALPSTAPSTCPSAPSVAPTSSPSGPSLAPSSAPTAAPSAKPSLFPTSATLVNITFASQQVISGLSSASYYSDQSRYSLTLRATIASCMTGLTPSNVAIVNVTDLPSSSSRRRLLAAPSSGIVSSYVVSVASQYSMIDLQSQLTASTATGLFNKQLTAFAMKFNSSAFVNATSKGLIILTTAPTKAPSAAPVAGTPSSPSPDKGLGPGPIAGLVIMSVVVAVLLCMGGYFYSKNQFFSEPLIATKSHSSEGGGGSEGGSGGGGEGGGEDPDGRPNSTQEDKVVPDRDLISYDTAYALVDEFASESSPNRPPSTPTARLSTDLVLRQSESAPVDTLSPSNVEIVV